MRALSLCQPFASMVAGQIPGWVKTIETRTWPTSHRGDLLICAGKSDWPCPRGYDGPPVASLPHGVALCVVKVTDCHRFRPADAEAACCDWYDSAIAWELTHRRLVTPFALRGRQGLFEVRAEAPTSFWREIGLPDPCVCDPRPASLVHA